MRINKTKKKNLQEIIKNIKNIFLKIYLDFQAFSLCKALVKQTLLMSFLLDFFLPTNSQKEEKNKE